jgi:hypothetical protein
VWVAYLGFSGRQRQSEEGKSREPEGRDKKVHDSWLLLLVIFVGGVCILYRESEYSPRITGVISIYLLSLYFAGQLRMRPH